MVKIRLARGGVKKNPFYFIVATDSRKRRDSSYIEKLGFYNPKPRGADIPIQLDLERVSYWVGHGAHISDRVNKVIFQYKQSQA